jgi:hypothetical protein
MKLFLKIFVLVLFAQLCGYFSLASSCDCQGSPPASNDPANNDCATCVGEGCIWNTTIKTAADCPAAATTGAGSVNLINPIGGNKDNPGGVTSVPVLIGNVLNVALGIVGSLALVMFIYGGFVWMLAAGNEQAVEKGKNILMWAAIGLVVIFASYSLVRFVINAITQSPITG